MNFMVEVDNSICRIEDYNDYKYAIFQKLVDTHFNEIKGDY